MPEAAASRIRRDFGLQPVIATEIEFYLHGSGTRFSQAEILARIVKACNEGGMAYAAVEAERGPDQYEVSFLPSRDILAMAAQTERFKTLIKTSFTGEAIKADFKAKPRRDIPGSGLHVHVHLEDEEGRNVFRREGEEFSPLLLNAIGGMLSRMNADMPVFAPYPESYERFIHTENSYLVCPTASNVPLTVSWGTNNRTTAIRLPTKPADNKHIEHRVAGSDTDTVAVIRAILEAIHYGLVHKCDPGEPVFGDACLPQYQKPLLARSLKEALAFRNQPESLSPSLYAVTGRNS